MSLEFRRCQQTPSRSGGIVIAARIARALLLLLPCATACQDIVEPTANVALNNSDASGSPLALQLERTGEGAGRFIVSGLTTSQCAQIERFIDDGGSWPELYRVVAGGMDEDLPPMLGSYALRDASLEFTTRWPLEAGVVYSAQFDTATIVGMESVSVGQFFVVAEPGAEPSTTVSAVYPSAEELPENLLKFYVHFSAAMTQGVAYRHVHLQDEQGGEVDDAFLEIAEELWSPDGRRLTLLLDPGRIKRDLRPHEEFGPALAAGQNYTLVIDASWPDASGQPLREDFEKSFRATTADRQSPDVDAWKLLAPAVATRDALLVQFNEPLDAALAWRLLDVRDADGNPVSGTGDLLEAERGWQFVPDEPWQSGPYALAVGTILEDLAGNSIARPFERSLDEPRDSVAEVVRIPFSVARDQ